LLCKAALRRRLLEILPEIKWIDGFSNYVEERATNFVSGITPDLYEKEYREGAGGELNWEIRNGNRCPPKMNALHSSSALVVNSFAPWKLHLNELRLCDSLGFCSLRFEAKVPTGLGGTPPHLDFLAESPSSSVAAESKLTEYLRPHQTNFAPAYSHKSWPPAVEPYLIMMRYLQENPSTFVYLDGAQLVKHALGLASRFDQHNVRLLYLFWEPENSGSYRDFDIHHKEIEQFSRTVTGASINFKWKTYLELWEEWAQGDSTWLQLHASELRKRYALTI